MASLSDYLELELLDHVMGTGAYTPPANIFVGLGTGATDAGLTGEFSGGSYVREEIPAGTGWNAAATRAITNNGIITFTTATGAWGTATHYGIYDQEAAGGNLLAWGALNDSKAIGEGNTATIADEEIVITFSAGGCTTFLANELLDHVFGNGVYAAPTLYLGLSTSSPTDAGDSETEPEDGYAREAIANWDAASSGATENTDEITFDAPSGSWGVITHQFIADDLTAGNILFWSTATPNQTPTTGDTVKFAAGAIDMTLD